MNIKELLSLPRLGKNDPFKFGCNQCGKCCRDREDILLTPLDLFKISKFLNLSIHEVLRKYCETYQGKDSKLPIVRIKPLAYRRTCPFLKGKCQIHPVHPAVCALYPLGRMTNEETKEFTYFLQPTKCGNSTQEQTVSKWLEGFSILEEESFTIEWHQKISQISGKLREFYMTHPKSDAVTNLKLFLLLYVLYDAEEDFMPQFNKNCQEALDLAQNLEANVDRDDSYIV